MLSNRDDTGLPFLCDEILGVKGVGVSVMATKPPSRAYSTNPIPLPSKFTRSHLTLSFTTSTPRISLSSLPSAPILSLTVQTQRTDAQLITLCTASSVLDNDHHARHDAVFRAAFLPLTSTSHPKWKIQIHFSGFPNYGSQPTASANLLQRDYLRFDTVPSKGDSELAVTHEISLERLFRHSDLRKEAVEVRQKFTVRMNPRRLGSTAG